MKLRARKYFSRLLNRKVDFNVVILLIILESFYVFFAFGAAWAKDDGTLGDGFWMNLFADSFFIFLYPCKLFTGDDFTIWLFTVGIVLNMIFYGVLVERIGCLLLSRKG